MHLEHPRPSRRVAIQAGAVGLLGLGMEHLSALRAADVTHGGAARRKTRSVIFIFLSGGLSQHDSFDMKPDAPDDIRGEFQPIATATPGIQICEHLPMLAQRSAMWALCRSLTHGSNEHSAGHHIMLTGRSDLPPGFSGSRPQATDWPSIISIAGAVTQGQNNLPPVAVLPERIVHNSGRVIPGQFAARMGERRNPWFVEASPFFNMSFGAFPEYSFDHQERGKPDPRRFGAPNLTLPHGLTRPRFDGRLKLLRELGGPATTTRSSGKHRQQQPFPPDRDFAAYRFTGPRGAGRHTSRGTCPAAIRQELIRLVAVDGAAAGGVGRQHGAGQPR